MTRHGSEIEAQVDVLMAGTEYGDADLARAMRAELGDLLAERRRLTVYLGFDPTSPNIHLGHAVVLHALARFQELGHRVVFVIGDFTALIGDPTGRSKTRPPLSREQVEQNAQTYAEQVFKVLRRDQTEIVYNSTWLNALELRRVVQLLSDFTVAQVLTRDDFKQRFEAGTPIHLHELLYSLTQGEDAVQLRTDVQVGGLDQLLNILTGRDVMRHRGLRPQVAVTLPLLPGTDGKLKMSKSYGNDIGVTLSRPNMYGKVMSLPDTAMADYYRLASGLPPADAAAVPPALASGALHPRDAKMRLARCIVSRWHGDAAASSAEAAFVAQFQRHEHEAPELLTMGVASVLDLLMATGVPKSRGAARRLVEGGGVTLDDARLGDWSAAVPAHGDGAVLRVGKRHVFRLRDS